jgi:hypothetical protein
MKNKSILIFVFGLMLMGNSLFSKEIPSLRYTNNKAHLDKSNANNNWTLINDAETQYPIRAFGTPVQINGFSEVNSSNIQQVAEAFISQFKDDLKINPANVKFSSSRSVNKLFYVTFKQYYNGIEVLKSEVELRIRKDAKLIAYGIKYYNDINLSVVPKFTCSQAVAKSLNIISSNKESDQLQSSNKLYILPKKLNGQTKYSLVYNVIVENKSAFTKLSHYLDANSAEIIEKRNLINNADTKIKIMASVNTLVPAATSEVPMPYLNFRINSSTYQTDSEGNATASLSSQSALSGSLEGKYTNVSCQYNSTGKLQSYVQPDVVNNIIIDNTTKLHERNAYYYVNLARTYLLGIEPGISSKISDVPINLVLTYDDSQINAGSSGETIEFYGLSISNNQMLNMPDVLFHEYGHSINKFLYNTAGNTTEGMINSTCNEALADVFAAGYIDEHVLCKNYDSDNASSFIRDIKNINIYPDSISNESHHDALILSGAFWDLREMTSLDYFKKISHFAKYGLPDDENVGIAFSEWFIETLIADDNMDAGNNDLSDGSPNFDKIVTAFENHHIGFSLYLSNSFSHIPKENFADAQTNLNFAYSFQVQPLNKLKVDSTFLVYSTDNFATSKRILSTSNSAFSYNSQIDYLPLGSIVKYYFVTYLNSSSTPICNYSDNSDKTPFSFLVGYRKDINESFQFSAWTFNGTDDNATVGKWTISYINYDATYEYYLPGFMPKSDFNGDNKVLVTDPIFGVDYFYDANNTHFTDGKTSVISPIYNTSELENTLVIFYEWLSLYSSYNDGIVSLIVDFSYDGGNSWQKVFDKYTSHFSWKKQLISCNPSENFRIRITLDAPVSFYSLNYLVKAFIDDLGIWTTSEKELGIKNDIADTKIKIYPSPANNYVNISANSNENITIINSLGETVTNIEKSADIYKWNRLDNNGNKVPAGIYFCKIKFNNSYKIEKIMITD